MDICENVLIRGVSNRLGGQIYVTHCNNYINYSQVKKYFGSSTALDMAKINQNGMFFLLG